MGLEEMCLSVRISVSAVGIEGSGVVQVRPRRRYNRESGRRITERERRKVRAVGQIVNDNWKMGTSLVDERWLDCQTRRQCRWD